MNILYGEERRKTPRAEKIDICGVRVDNATMSESVETIGRLVTKGASDYVVTPNVDHVVRFQDDDAFRRVYAKAALVLADGMPLLWAGKYLGKPFKEKVSGSDLVPALCAAAVKKNHRLFFLGGRPGAAALAKTKLEARYPGIRIVGHYAPAFGFEYDAAENTRIIGMIRETAPDILLIGLGSPKQEKWAHQHGSKTGVPVMVGVGVTFEFIAGMVSRAPKFMQRSGLEWLWRLLSEPTRLWRRYLLDDPRFFWLLFKQKTAPAVPIP
jgi:N-acetylglucosaminyldiphosphoundecaprenol N-acetyl-beta-D-mannosaminyltransferase